LFKTRMHARLYALRRIVGNDSQVIPLLRDMQKEYPRAFAWLMNRLDAKVSAIREERLAEVPPPLTELPEGKLETRLMPEIEEVPL